MIIIVFGLPGSGKSFLATRLAAALDAVYVSTDELRLKLVAHRTYSEVEKSAVYDAMLHTVTTAIPGNRDVVLDGTFYKASIRAKFEALAITLNVKLRYIEVRASEEVIKVRLEKPRVNSEANYDVYLSLRKTAEPLDKDHLILISTNDNIDSMLNEALHYVATKR